MRFQVKEIQSRSILTPQKFGSLVDHYDFTLNPYAGCGFGCSYCYVPKFPNAEHEYSEWGTWVVAKLNAAQLIARDRTLIFGSRIFFSSATDPYQYIELKYRLSRQCLQELLKYGPARVTMHTRSHLILQDLDLLKAFGDRLQVGISITTDDDEIRRQFEPGAPSIRRRLQLVEKLHAAGVEIYASLAPLLPCDPDRLVGLLKPYISRAWVDEMHYPEINTRPYLREKYKEFFADSNYRATVQRVSQGLHTPRTPRYRARPAQASRPASQPIVVQGKLW